MLLLDELTEQLGPLEEWLTYVLQYLFLDRPEPTRASRLRKVVILLWKQCTSQDCGRLNQQELVLPEPGMQFGIDETTYPNKIRRRLEELPSLVLVDDADDCSPLSD